MHSSWRINDTILSKNIINKVFPKFCLLRCDFIIIFLIYLTLMSSLELAKHSVVEQEPEPQEAKTFGRSWDEVLAPAPGQNKNGY
jgi:hypothetical protein